jgi:hypothetical protein
MVAVIYLLTAHPEDLHLPGTMGISLVCWAGIFGLIPIYLADIRHLELIRRSLQFELSSIEASNRWLPQTVTDTKMGSLQEVGPLASSVARFYLFFFGVLTIISAAVALDHFSEQPAWWLVLHLVLHIGAILTMALISKRLLKINTEAISSFQAGRYGSSPLDKSTWESSWIQYALGMEVFAKLAQRIFSLRTSSSFVFMACATVTSIIVSTSESLFMIDRMIAIAVVCVLGALSILIIWCIDVFGYQKHVSACTQTLGYLESKFSFIPKFSHNFLQSLNRQKAPIAITIYYCHIQILLTASVLSFGFSPLCHFPKSLVFGLGILVSVAVFSMILIQSNRKTVFGTAKKLP